MKKLLVLFAASFLCIGAVQSQEFRLGAKLGLNIASLGGDTYGIGSLGAITSFHVGGLVEIPLLGDLAVQPELLYSSEGSDFSFGNIGTNLKLDYIRIPLLAKYYLIEGLSAEAGPVFGVLVSANSANSNVKENFNTLDAAFAFGASYSLDLGIFFSFRYNRGLLNVNKNYIDNGTTYNYKNQSNVFQLSAGYYF